MKKFTEKEKQTELNKELFNDKLNFEKTHINKSKKTKPDLTVEKTFDIRRFDTQDLNLISNSINHGNNPHRKTDITSFDLKYTHNNKANKNILIISIAVLTIVVLLLLILILFKVI